MISPRLFAGTVITCLLLLTVVVTVGLIRDQLSVTSVATVLSTLLSGIVVGALVRRPNGKGGED